MAETTPTPSPARLSGALYLGTIVFGLFAGAAPAFTRMLSPHLMDPTLIGEAALAFWLLVFGTRTLGAATRTAEPAPTGMIA